jgi:uncharacterized protein (TIGR02145 family)
MKHLRLFYLIPMTRISLSFALIAALVLAAHGGQQRIAIMGTEDDGEPSIKILEASYLTDKLREIASKTLPKTDYIIMTQQSIVDRLGSQEQAAKICKEATCLVDLGRKVNADYIAQARIGRFGGNLTIKVELYRVGNGGLISSFIDNSKNVQGLLKILEAKSPAMFKEMLPKDTAKSNGNASNASGSFFTDSRNGQKYRIVKIGSQTWMAENLNYNASGSKCYDNLESNCKKYGRLYDWNTAMKVCPSGWHLPNKAEWDVLSNFVGGEKVAGKHLKAKNGWENNGNGQDTYGLAALPGGIGSNFFSGAGDYGKWWSSSESGRIDDIYISAYCKLIHYYYENASWSDENKNYSLLSVRCIQN